MITVKTGCIFALATLFGGCTTIAMEGMNGPGACDPMLAHQAMYNASVLSSLDPDQSLKGLLALSQPDHQSGSTLYYRTGAPHCSYLATATEFTPVHVSPDGKIINPSNLLTEAAAVPAPFDPLKTIFR